MKRLEAVTLTNMCMIKDKDKILVLNRTDPVWPGLTFPGGHVESHEAFHDSVVRNKRGDGIRNKGPAFSWSKAIF